MVLEIFEENNASHIVFKNISMTKNISLFNLCNNKQNILRTTLFSPFFKQHVSTVQYFLLLYWSGRAVLFFV